MRYAYLGPEATFTEAALLSYLGEQGQTETATTLPMRGAAAALDAVLDGDCAAAIVPIDALPRNATGKVLRNVLADRYRRRYHS